MRFTEFFAGAVVVGGVTAGAIGLGAGAAAAAPGDPVVPPMPPAAADPGQAPAWAPPQPVPPSWANGSPQVWDEGWQHWGVWMNGVFIPTY